ncbi:MAG: PPC domain-containing protein [bacterium]
MSCAGQRCDEATRACLPNPCETDRDCTRTQFCAPQGCLEGCRVDPDNCPIGQECGPNRQCRQAGGCANDAQCVTDNGPGWRCVDGGCETFCVDDNGCRDGEYCEVETGHCIEGCLDDGLEENDERAGATPLQLANDRVVEDGLIACSLDRDWYSFQTARGYGARVTVRFRHANGDLDLRVYPPEGDSRASQSQTDDEVVTIDQVAAAGTWYVEVYARGLDANDYQLEVELLAPGGCAPDAAEATGDDSPGTATAVAVPGLQDVVAFRNRTRLRRRRRLVPPAHGHRRRPARRADGGRSRRAPIDFCHLRPRAACPGDAPDHPQRRRR